MLNPADLELKILFEEQSLSPSEISDLKGWEVEAVKARLMQISPAFKESLRAATTTGNQESGDLEITDQEKRTYLEMYKGMLHDSDVDPNLRARILRDLLNEKLGRNKVVLPASITHNTQVFNINNINESIRAAKERTKELNNAVSKPSIDIESRTNRVGEALVIKAA